MKVLVAGESGRVRDAFISRGHDAISCDILPTDSPGPHIQGDVREVLNGGGWDLIIAHPPCTYLCCSGLFRNVGNPERVRKTKAALEFVRAILDADCPRIALENPVGCISTSIRKPDQSIQPYEFGDDASKKTCLWLKGIPLLKPTEFFPPRIVDGKKRWGNQTDSGQNKLPPSANRAKLRSVTYAGIARAMADQWGL